MDIRRWHSYLGLLIAPSVLFFALTGAVQIFGLHEAHDDYQPPALIEKLSSVHKDQVFELGDHGPPPPDSSAGQPNGVVAFAVQNLHAGHDDHDSPGLPTTLLKWYFLIVAVALTVSTGFGIWMGLTQIRRKSLAWTLLFVGAAVPLALLLL
jgi:hypothetical protein